MLRHLGWVCGLMLVFFCSGSALAAKDLLPVQLDDLYLQMQARSQEPSTGGIDSPQWRLGVASQFAPWVDIKASVGASSLLYRPYWGTQPTESVSPVDVRGTLHSFMGDFYGGQFRVPWGLQSADEEELWLPRTLLYERGFFPLRDVGAGFTTELDGFYMNVAVHNGEGGGLNNQDNRMFVTGQWGYKGAANSNLGFAATSGRIGPPVVTQELLVRGAAAFFGFHIFGLGLQLEGSIFQTHNDTTNPDIVAWHSDLEHPITEHLNLVGRYEQLNPNTKVVSNILGRGTLGFEYHSKDNVSRLFVLFLKNNESLQETHNDEVRIVWRLSPPVQ